MNNVLEWAKFAKLEPIKEDYFYDTGSGDFRWWEVANGKTKAQVVASAASQPTLRRKMTVSLAPPAPRLPTILDKESLYLSNRNDFLQFSHYRQSRGGNQTISMIFSEWSWPWNWFIAKAKLRRALLPGFAETSAFCSLCFFNYSLLLRAIPRLSNTLLFCVLSLRAK